MIVAGDRSHGLNVLVERKIRLTHISLLEDKTTASTKRVMLRRLKRHHAPLKQSMTYNNRSENTGHEEINATVHSQSFFCPLYHSWNKRSLEQVNELLRRFLPKDTNVYVRGKEYSIGLKSS